MKKNIFRYLLAAGIIAIVFAGCKKSEFQQAQEPVKVTLRADRPGVQDETKTQLNGASVLWSVGDQIGVTNNAESNPTNKYFTNDAQVPTNSTTFTGVDVSGNLFAYYPYSSENITSTGAKVTIKTTQNPDSNASFDGSCDVLVSKPFTVSPEGKQLSDLVFRRLTAVLKIVIMGNGIPSDEKISSIKLESSTTNLTGKVNVSFEKFDLDGFTSSTNSVKSVTVNAATPFNVDGTTGLLACVYPGKFAAGSKLTVSGTTSNCTFKKEIDLTSELKFECGEITTLNVTIGAGNVTPSASFLFNSDAGLSSLGIVKPADGSGTNLGTNRYSVAPISMIVTDGSTATRVYNSNGSTDLRVYSGGTLSISGATIKKIEFTGTDLTKLSSNSETYTNGTWSGSAKSVKFTANGTVNINTIVVTYEPDTAYDEYNVSCATVDGGTLSASPVWAEAGTQITLTATPDAEYVFNNDWSVKDASEDPVTVTDGKFTMPESNVTVSASFTKKTYTITKTTPENGTFVIKVNGEESLTASKGDAITLEATPADGYEFGMWNVVNGATNNPITISDNAFTMPGANVTIGVTFITADSVPVYASLADLVAAGAPTSTGSLVTVTLTDQIITKLYKSGEKINGVYFMVGTQEVEIYCKDAPSTWNVGGSISGTLTKCIWQLYGTTWELCPNAWAGLTYKAPCATPTITFTGNKATIECTTDGATIKYGISNDDTQPEINTTYTTEVELSNGQTIWAQATKDGMMPSDVASKKYTAGGETTKTETLTKEEITKQFTNDKMAYATEESFTDGDITWSAKAYADANNRPWMQLKKDSGVYIKITAPTAIKEVRLTITSTSNTSGGITDITKHDAFSGTVRLKSDDALGDNNKNDIVSTNSVVNNSATLTVSSPTNKTVYVKVSIGARIWGIEVDY